METTTEKQVDILELRNKRSEFKNITGWAQEKKGHERGKQTRTQKSNRNELVCGREGKQDWKESQSRGPAGNPKGPMSWSAEVRSGEKDW